MNISIIIPNYNGENILKRNLPDVLAAVNNYNEGNVEIIIADDPSTDNSKEVIEEFIRSIKAKHVVGRMIENKNKNESGFSKNVNRGVSISTGDILILLNSDVSPHKNFLQPLLSHFSDPAVFAVGCMDESIEEGKTVLRGRGVGTWQRGFLMHSEGKLDKADTLWVSGGSSAIRKTLWDKLKGLDVLFNPFYWEDIDLSYRALKSGYKIIFEKESIVVHEHEKGAIKTKFKSSYIKKIAYRNQFVFIWKNITEQKLLNSHIFWLPYHLLKAIVNQDKELVLGFVQALFLLPQIIEKRRLVKKLFIEQDSAIIKRFNE